MSIIQFPSKDIVLLGSTTRHTCPVDSRRFSEVFVLDPMPWNHMFDQKSQAKVQHAVSLH